MKVFCSMCAHYDGGELCYAKENKRVNNWKGEKQKPELCEEKNFNNDCQEYRRAMHEYE